jgi:TonB family protein
MKTSFIKIAFALILVLLIVVTAKAQNNNVSDNSSDKNEKKNSEQIKDKPLKISKKPSPSTDGNCPQNTGVVRVRATFHSSGKVTDAEMVAPSKCEYFNDQALKAARKIKFEPQIKNGEVVTVTKIVEYKFRIY